MRVQVASRSSDGSGRRTRLGEQNVKRDQWYAFQGLRGSGGYESGPGRPKTPSTVDVIVEISDVNTRDGW